LIIIFVKHPTGNIEKSLQETCQFIQDALVFFYRSPPGEKHDTGGKTPASSVPVVATPPLQNALRTNL